jgi:tetratricopeptide (TPR) repeat protein
MDKALSLAPNEAEIYNSRAVLYSHRGQDDLALGDYNKAVELAPGFAEFWANRSTCHLRLGHKDKALADVTEAIRLAPKSAPAYLHRGLYYMDQRDYNQAVTDFTTAIGNNPRYASAYYRRAIAYYRLFKTDQALADMSAAINIEKKPFWYSERGMIYLRRKGDYDSAAADFDQAARLATNASMKSSASHAHVLRAEALWRQNRLADSLAACDRALELDPQNGHAYAQRGWARVMSTLGTFKGPDVIPGCEQALRDCNTAIRLNRNISMAYCARSYAELGILGGRGEQLNPQQAAGKLVSLMRDLDTAIELDNSNAYAYLLRSIFHKLLGDQQKSQADYNRAVRLDPKLREVKLP